MLSAYVKLVTIGISSDRKSVTSLLSIVARYFFMSDTYTRYGCGIKFSHMSRDMQIHIRDSLLIRNIYMYGR